MKCVKNSDGSYDIRLYGDNKEEMLLAEAISTLTNARWISINDKLPEINEVVLIYDIDGNYSNAYRMNDKNWYFPSDMGSYDDIVTHWMPLLKRPKGI